jgi:hypothetical protein
MARLTDAQWQYRAYTFCALLNVYFSGRELMLASNHSLWIGWAIILVIIISYPMIVFPPSSEMRSAQP